MTAANFAHDESESKFTGWPAYLRRLWHLIDKVHGTHFVADTSAGRDRLTALLVAEESRDSIMNRAPFLTDAEYDTLAARARGIREETRGPLGGIIGRLLQLTDAERTEHEAWLLWPIDKTRAEIRARQAAARVVKRRGERWKLRERIMREGPDTNDRELLLLSIIATPRPNWKSERWTVAEIIKAVMSTRPRQLLPGVTVIPRDLFAQGRRLRQASVKQTVHRVLDRLEDRGRIESRYHDAERGLRVRTVQIKQAAGGADRVPIDRKVSIIAHLFCDRRTVTPRPVTVAYAEKAAKTKTQQDVRPQCDADNEMTDQYARARVRADTERDISSVQTTTTLTKTLRPLAFRSTEVRSLPRHTVHGRVLPRGRR